MGILGSRSRCSTEENRSPGCWSPMDRPGLGQALLSASPPPQFHAAPAAQVPSLPPYLLAKTVLYEGLDPSSLHHPLLTMASHSQGGAAPPAGRLRDPGARGAVFETGPIPGASPIA